MAGINASKYILDLYIIRLIGDTARGNHGEQ